LVSTSKDEGQSNRSIAGRAGSQLQVAIKLLQESRIRNVVDGKCRGCNRQTQRSTMMMQGTQVRGMCRKTAKGGPGKKKRKEEKASISARTSTVM
jgi:hypothetical protein